MRRWAALTVAIATEVAGSLSLKAAQTQPVFFVIVVIGYAVAFTAITFALCWGLSLGVGYGIWGALGVVLTAIGSNVLFEEPLTPVMLAGIALIMAGVLLVELGAPSRQGTESGGTP